MKYRDRVAIVGIGGVFPGARSLAEFWQNIFSGASASRQPPPGRWLLDPSEAFAPDVADDKVYSNRACFVEDFALDLTGLDLDPELIAELDPLVHVLLHAGRDAFVDSVTSGVDCSRFGVVLGNIALPTDSSSALAVEILGRTFAEKVTGGLAASSKRVHPANRYVTGLPAGLLAKGLGLGGGTVTLDAACASSLYAVKLAVDELLSGRVDAMLAGGVSRPDCLYTQMGFSQLRALSASGRCSPFDSRADGLVVGEGAGVVVLKRLEDALQAGDHIYATIAGIGLSNDIGGNLLAPDSEGQLRAMRAAYRQAGWQPDDVDLIECHGTGTPIGDAVEFESLRQLRGDSTSNAPCVIGSVKSNVGHLLTGAGAAGLIKVLLALKNQTLPPTANFNQPSSKLRLEETAFRVLAQAEEWRPRLPGQPRKAALSAFGFGGINAHVLLEEWLPAQQTAANVLIPSSIQSKPVPIAIVGAACRLAGAYDLDEFVRRSLFGQQIAKPDRQPRWWGAEQSNWFATENAHSATAGYHLHSLRVPLQRFRIPPVELRDMLPQQLLMLEAAADALDDQHTARKPENGRRERTGVFIGIGLDLNTTNFHFRWWIKTQARRWAEQAGLQLTDAELDEWTRQLRDAAGPPLTANRTMGALGGVVASRIAREFRVGGPSYTLSCEECSGLRALEVAVRSLQQGEIDDAIVGGVDLATEVRAALSTHRLNAVGDSTQAVPGDGAVALILKRLDDAERDGDKIYAVIEGAGTANASSADSLSSAVRRAMENTYRDAQVDPKSVGLIETQTSGTSTEASAAWDATQQFFPPTQSLAYTSAAPVVGHTGAASGLVSVLRAALALRHCILPGDSNGGDNTSSSKRPPKYWLHDRGDGVRRAAVTGTSVDGNCVHVVLSEASPVDSPDIALSRPRLACAEAIFVCEGDSITQLQASLEQLRQFAEAAGSDSLDVIAAKWWQVHAGERKRLAVAIIASDRPMLAAQIADSLQSLAQHDLREAEHTPNGKLHSGRGKVFFSAEPLCGDGADNKVAFVFPGSGNHFAGMGRELCLYWPQVVARQERESEFLRSQMLPDLLWSDDPAVLERATPQQLILAQVSLGSLVYDVVSQFGVRPHSVIGYSLGETTALFATRAWRERDEMLQRLTVSPLFREQLAGPCHAARKAWNLAPGENVNWLAGVVDRPADLVRSKLTSQRRVYLLIVNTAEECVIGGQESDVRQFVQELGCRFFPLQGVSTVHCDIVDHVADDYRTLHLLPTEPPTGIKFYSSAWGGKYDLNRESAAEAILANAQKGADFPATVRAAYDDGVRVFVEIGPGMSCSRMIGRILGDQPHLARSACVAGQDAQSTLLRLLGALIAERVPVDLAPLHQPVLHQLAKAKPTPPAYLEIPVGGDPFVIPPPPATRTATPPAKSEIEKSAPALPKRQQQFPPVTHAPREQVVKQREPATPQPVSLVPTPSPAPPAATARSERQITESPRLTSVHASSNSECDITMTANISDSEDISSPLLRQASDTLTAAANAHAAYLQFSQNMTELMAEHLQRLGHGDSSWQTESILTAAEGSAPMLQQRPVLEGATPEADCFMSRAKCLEYAIGSIAAVLGPEFAEVDQYPTRVRLPDEPLMLADRIVTVEGEPRRLTSGRVVTEHDVLPGAWYLDGNRIPTCIAVEAGQADLFLSGYLGIDFKTKGLAVYRLLDAVVTFHQGLPQPGEVIRYDIRIERFFRQGETYLFRFSFESTVNGRPLLSMRDGCAGFFTMEELQAGKGIVHTKLDLQPMPGKLPDDWRPLVPLREESYDVDQIDALRRGDLQACFGEPFGRLPLRQPMRLPGGRMTLIDRVTKLDPTGGRFGLGQITAEADILPNDWFLTCHFVDDRVMPGTLMYECCLHTLRVLLMRMGWVAEHEEVAWEPIPGVASRLKCRGQVIETTRTAKYQITLKELGYGPEPYAIADALMFADGKAIVEITDMSVRLTGATRASIESLWAGITDQGNSQVTPAPVTAPTVPVSRKPAIFDSDRILAFAIGKPSEAFGEPYKIFDEERVIARLPGPPYQFLDRITELNAEPWKMVAGGTVEGEYDVPPDAWYFAADRQPTMPFAVLLEVGLQVCGWLAAYIGSALTSETDLSFRNLGGKAIQYAPVYPDAGTLTTFVKITRVSSSGGMIIQNFDFEVRDTQKVVYSGDTYFGFFSKQALAQQIGIRDAQVYRPTEEETMRGQSFPFPHEAPFPDRQMRMLDTVDLFVPDGGPNGLGFLRGSKVVDPNEWFFKAHFYQDPVNPGSLGLEAFVQLLKLYAVRRWGGGADSWLLPMVGTAKPHEWIYRGQVIPTNKKVTVEAVIQAVDDTRRSLVAGGFLAVDGRIIYQMIDFTLTMAGKPE